MFRFLVLLFGLLPIIALPAPSLHHQDSPSFLRVEKEKRVKVTTTGQKNVLFLRVGFLGQGFTKDEAYFNDLILRFVDYYDKTSYGKLNIVTTLSTTYTLVNAMNYYGIGNIGSEKIGELINDAKATATDINFSNYDHIMVLHAGYGEETSKNIEDISSQYFNETSIIPEMEEMGYSPLGVWCHEFGHYLQGDQQHELYGSTWPGLGAWSLMAYGCYNDNGNHPAHLDAFSKLKFGWIVPQDIEQLYLPLKPTLTVYRLGSGAEYFLVEWREKKGFDSFIPGEGFFIYHIDELGSQENINHPKVALIQADGNKDLENNRNWGDNGDPWPGSSGNTAPSLLYYNGSPSGFSIKIITPSILQIKAYPNPLNLAKNNTVFFDAPPKSLIKIYNINGELVGEAKDRYIGKMSWKPKDIASGVYIFVAEDPEGNRGYGKIGVIK